MDAMLRKLERDAATGDEQAAERLARRRMQIQRAEGRARYAQEKAAEEAAEAELRRDPVGRFARIWSPAGPCFIRSGVAKSGRIARQTAKFYVTESQNGPRTVQKRVRKDKVHLLPCPRCTDHADTQYPMGYMD